jgi:hypothetical protein
LEFPGRSLHGELLIEPPGTQGRPRDDARVRRGEEGKERRGSVYQLSSGLPASKLLGITSKLLRIASKLLHRDY